MKGQTDQSERSLQEVPQTVKNKENNERDSNQSFFNEFETHSQEELMQNPSQLKIIEEKIRQYYLIPQIKPQHFCSYASFSLIFPPPSILEAYKSQNRNIIDIHLRYHQLIHEKMVIYKWIPSILVCAVTKFRPIGLMFPLLYVSMFDYYFKNFMIWKHRNDKIINIRSQFISKLSKPKNILRRVMLFESLKDHLGQEKTQIPIKYIKFGESTEYIFHTTMNDLEESNIYLTPLFQNYMAIKGINRESIFNFFVKIKETIKLFQEYKKTGNKKQMPIFIDRQKLLHYKDIKQSEIYDTRNQIENRLKRFLQMFMYWKTNQFYRSNFKIADFTNLNKHYDLTIPKKFNLETNKADFTIFYGFLFTLKLLQFIIKRSIRL